MFKKSIANTFTLLNLILGFSSLILISLALINKDINFMIASCYLIFAASITDVFDGKIARKLKTSGSFGKQLDSMADLVSFCLFPSFLLFGYFYFYKDNHYIGDWFIYFFTSMPLILGAIRLARFNAYSEESENESYSGLPTPANCIFITSIILNLLFYNEYESNFFISWINNINQYTFPILLSIISSILLVTKFSYSKFPILKFKVSFLNTLNILLLIIFVISLFCGFYFNKMLSIINLFIMFYLLSGPIKSIIKITGNKV